MMWRLSAFFFLKTDGRGWSRSVNQIRPHQETMCTRRLRSGRDRVMDGHDPWLPTQSRLASTPATPLRRSEPRRLLLLHLEQLQRDHDGSIGKAHTNSVCTKVINVPRKASPVFSLPPPPHLFLYPCIVVPVLPLSFAFACTAPPGASHPKSWEGADIPGHRGVDEGVYGGTAGGRFDGRIPRATHQSGRGEGAAGYRGSGPGTFTLM